MSPFRLALGVVALVIAQVASAADDNEYFPKVEHIKLHLAQGGGGHAEVLSVWDAALYADAKDDTDPSAYDFLAEFGATNRKTTSSKIDDKTVRVVTHGDFADIFQFIRIVDSAWPFHLRADHVIDLKWDGKVLLLHMAYLDGEKPKVVDVAGITLEITTDGRFTENSLGEVNEDRTRITIKEGAEWRIEVEGLTAEKPE